MMRKLMLLWKYRKTVRAMLSAELSILTSDGIAEALGGLTEEETEGVCRWVSALPQESVVVEMGTLFGLTAQAMAEVLPEGGRILSVDCFCWNPLGLPPRLHEQFTRRILRPYEKGARVCVVNTTSETFRNTYDGPTPAMVFLDADHRYEAVRDEIAWAKKTGVPVICGHDYGNPLFGVTRAVDEAFPDGVECAGMCWRAKM